MTGRQNLSVVAAIALTATSAVAQPADLPIAPATTTTYPAGVKVAKAAGGPVYTDQRGQTLYGMDMRTVLRWSPDPAQFCQAECAAQWEPLLAPPGAAVNIAFPIGFGDRAAPPSGFVSPQKAPDWTVIKGPAGPQWVYKGWHMVYVRKGAKRLSTEFDGADNLTWNTLKFVPPVPQIVAPAGIAVVYSGGAYLLTTPDGHALFTGKCSAKCDQWTALAGPMAGKGMGDWSVSAAGDQAQWLYRGKPVFVSQNDDPLTTPAGTAALHP